MRAVFKAIQSMFPIVLAVVVSYPLNAQSHFNTNGELQRPSTDSWEMIRYGEVGAGLYRTVSSTQTDVFTVPAYLAFSPVSGVAESADLDNVKVIGYKLYERIALLDGSENGNAGSSDTSCIERAFHYDRKGRVMQVVEKNSTGGISRTSTRYDFRGNILAVNESHSTGALTITKGTVYSYDQRGRLLSERVSINGVEKATVSYSYNALGYLTGKSYGNGVTDNLQYNIQGWGTVSQTVKGSETLYSQRLRYYDAEKGSGLYNGSISEWRVQQGTNTASTYSFSYDAIGRLTSSSRYAGTGSTAVNSWCERGMDYDLNGNITTLQRFGSSASAVEDNLSYSYSGNRLTALTGSSQGATLNASYSYDAGGNMLYDGRRGLGISYNMLNLPAKVVEKAGATAADGAVKAEYLYSADGIKQRVADATGSNGYLYLGTLVLSKSGESYSLASTGFGGGRIIGGAGNSCLAYYYGTDHLGSVRVITDGSGSVVERNDYYPMGMRTATGNSYPQLAANLYKYNGKEVQTVGGLGFTDYGARMYDDFSGRWFVPDPLAEKYASMSPYMYCGGNPIMYVDIKGQKLRIANNYKVGMENIAKIAATSLGKEVLNRLINIKYGTYYLKSTIFSKSSKYNPNTGDIYYVGNPWSTDVDGGVLNSMTAMGHEAFHAFDHSFMGRAVGNVNITEPRAVSFANYLREAYNLTPLRERYGGIQGDFHQFRADELITDFKQIDISKDKTKMGYSYTKTTTIVDSYKTIYNRRFPDKTHTETSNNYIIVSRDKDNNISFEIYDSYDKYAKSREKW